ncbi:MAG: ribbon-helix-helix domain-containing protein [Janthinobacterium lividum]
MASTLVLRSVLNGTKRSTMRLEPEFWTALEGIARAENATVNDLVAQAQDKARGQTGSVRVFVLQWFGARLTRSTLAAMASTEIAQGSPAPPRS